MNGAGNDGAQAVLLLAVVDIQLLVLGDGGGLGLHVADQAVGVGAQLFAQVGLAESLTEKAEGVAGGAQCAIDEDDRNAEILLERIELALVLLVPWADVDDHLGIGRQYGLLVEIAGIPVEIPVLRQIAVPRVDVLGGVVVGLGRPAHQLVGRHGVQHHVGQLPCRGDAGDLPGQLDLATGGVGETDGGGLNRCRRAGGFGVDVCGLGAAGQGHRGHRHQCEQLPQLLPQPCDSRCDQCGGRSIRSGMRRMQRHAHSFVCGRWGAVSMAGTALALCDCVRHRTPSKAVRR